jgi:UDP-N-acetylmuramoyl-tripeptide--D-alanyl-D-alanine ligase
MISFLLSIIIFLINGISVLRLYQIKDYLYYRVIAHFYLPESKKIILNKKELIIYFLCFISAISLFSYNLQNFWNLEFLIFLLILFLILRARYLKKIVPTPKAIIITSLSFIINFLLLLITDNSLLIFILLTTWVWQFIVFTIAIFIFNICVKPYLNYLGKKVNHKINLIKKQNPEFKIIGIVGSYGKSSTKEFLIQLLKEKFNILTTPPRLNHEYALLKFLLKAKIENYDFLIIEFGSYYLGNIKFITKFITPDIAYITGITKQHLFLFGDIDNIIIGEGTEILSWMKEGILIVNKNHQFFSKLQKKIKEIADPKIKIYTYGFDADFNYKILENNLERCVFEMSLKESSLSYTFETNIIFPMQIENICGALVYISLIDDLKNYREKIKNLELPEGFLKLKIRNNLYIFDDSYNANPKGVFDSLDFFQNLKFDYKIIIFNGLFELGKETNAIYKELIHKFLNFDKIIVTSENFWKLIENNAKSYQFATEINNKYNKNKKELQTQTATNKADKNQHDNPSNLLKEKLLLIIKSQELVMFLRSFSNKKVGVWIFNRFPSNFKILF